MAIISEIYNTIEIIRCFILPYHIINCLSAAPEQYTKHVPKNYHKYHISNEFTQANADAL